MMRSLAAILVGAALIAGCRTDPAALPGTWTLESLEIAAAPPIPPPGPTRPTVTFMPPENGVGEVHGFGGVNRFFGRYSVGGPDHITVSSLGSTRMAGPPALMALERVFIGLVQTAARYSVQGDVLTLTSAEGGIARLTRTRPPTEEGAEGEAPTTDEGGEAPPPAAEGDQESDAPTEIRP